MDKHDEIWLRGESANISNTLNCAGLVLASWYPDHPTDPGWPGSIVAVSGEPNFPLDAWEARDKDALRAWLERAHPEWVTVVEDA